MPLLVSVSLPPHVLVQASLSLLFPTKALSELHRVLAPGGRLVIGLETWGVVAEIWQHIDAASPSDELDIVRVADDYDRT